MFYGGENMITFACKSINQEDMFKCSFGLNKTEYNVLVFLFEQNKPLIALDIAKKMKLERTTVQKAVKNLVEKDLIRRNQENLAKGGYSFLYEVDNKKGIKYKLRKVVSEWNKKVEKFIDDL